MQKKNPWDDLPDADEEVTTNPWDELPDAEEEIIAAPEVEELPVEEIEVPQETIQLAPAQMGELTEEKSPWDKFRSPLTDIGSRTAKSISGNIEGEHPHSRFARGAIDFLGSAVDEATAPINAIPTLLTGGAGLLKSPALALAGRLASIPTAISGSQRMREAEGFGDWGLGALETIGGIFGMKGPKIAGKVDEIADATKVADEVVPPANVTPEPEIPVLPTEAPPVRPTNLPVDLAGAKPRANMGGKIFIPQFESDIDKALYIIAQTNKSKRDADYMKFLTEATGLEPDALMKLAQTQKTRIKEMMGKSQVTGDIQIPKMWKPEVPVNPKIDYSVVNEKRARQLLKDQGIPTENLDNKQIIEAAETLQPGFSAPKEINIPKEVAKPGAPKPKYKLNTDDTITFPEYPDLKINPKTGQIVGTRSGKPVTEVLPPAEAEAVKSNLAFEIANAPKALISSVDLSFPFRQGATLMHKKAWRDAWVPMIKSFGDQKVFDSTMSAINNRPNALPSFVIENGKPVKGPSLYERAGLAITDTSTNREIEHMGRITEKLPWVKASNRAYTAFANLLRADTFDSLVNDFAKAGIDVSKDPKQLEALGNFVNNASGRGSLKYGDNNELAKSAQLLNAAVFSPHLIDSRLKMFGNSAEAIAGGTLDLMRNPQAFAMTAPSVRKEYLKSMMALGTAWGTMATAAASMGANVSLDPTSSDFMKIKIGDTRLDPGAGFQQFIVLASRIAKSQTTSSTDGKTKPLNEGAGPFDPTADSVFSQFAFNKASPSVRIAKDWAQRNVKKPFDWTEQTARAVTPIIIQDLMEILGDEEATAGELATLPLNIVGVGTQTYGDRGNKRRMLDAFGEGFGSNLAFPKKKGFFN